MTLAQSSANAVTEYVVDSGDGITIASATSKKLGFYGVTPAVQPSVLSGTAMATTAAVSTSSWGFSTSTQALQVVNAVNALKTLGLIG